MQCQHGARLLESSCNRSRSRHRPAAAQTVRPGARGQASRRRPCTALAALASQPAACRSAHTKPARARGTHLAQRCGVMPTSGSPSRGGISATQALISATPPWPYGKLAAFMPSTPQKVRPPLRKICTAQGSARKQSGTHVAACSACATQPAGRCAMPGPRWRACAAAAARGEQRALGKSVRG
jgi:hypothetical protein